ncbi:MAG TPA: type II secretion system F family protein [Candidatus Saccharimonas sp.]|nr:type II secretion system F family protein [Candidatus Saccharimonas sp.]
MSLRLSGKDKLALVSNLGTMLSSGIPIIEAVDSMLEEAKGNLRAVLLLLKADLSEGRTVSVSLARSPKAFDPVMVNLVKAAEEAGTLDETLKDMVDSIKKEMEFSSNIRASLAYPTFICVVFMGVLVLILSFVIPRVSKIFVSLHVPLPITTKVMFWVSTFMLAYWPYLLGGLIAAIVAVVVLFERNRRQVINALYSLPLLRRLGRAIDLARLTRSLSQLLHAGLPIVEALELAKNVVNKREVVAVVAHTQEVVSTGHPLASGLKAGRKVVPGMMLRIVEAAETSGTLETAMQDLNEYFEAQVDSTLRTMTTLLEPILLVVIGVMVGGMMISIIGPIYGLIGQVNAH